MSTIKTAISLDKSLFDEADELAHQMKVSRSRLFSLAVEEFIHRQESKDMLRKINEAYEDGGTDDFPSPDVVRRHMRRMAEDEW